MTIHRILKYPHTDLRRKSVDVYEKEDIKTLVKDLAETMYAANGMGLAAPQIGVLKRVFVIDCDWNNNKKNLGVFINPVIKKKFGWLILEEGCLSFPNKYRTIDRPEEIIVEALDINMHPFELRTNGDRAQVIQHEIDHLNGVLLIDSALRV